MKGNHPILIDLRQAVPKEYVLECKTQTVLLYSVVDTKSTSKHLPQLKITSDLAYL